MRPLLSRLLWALSVFVLSGPVAQAAGEGRQPTRVIVLGVDHSAQLVARNDQPAQLEAFLDRAKPDAICVERSPEAFARNDFYEFTYEVQGVILPYARRTGVDLCPIDWVPSHEDEMLGFGLDIETPPEVRPAQGFQQFLTFPDKATLSRGLLHAEDPANLAKVRQWASQPATNASDDLPRRLYLYRTFMQAKRLAHAAKAHPGGTVVLVVGEFHKPDIEAIVANDPGIQLVRPSAVGIADEREVAKHDRPEYRHAIATFNLLGAQAETGNLNFAWLREVVKQLTQESNTTEVRLLATRLDLLEGRISAAQAMARYERMASEGDDQPMMWNGVQDRSRIDSYFDPFGNLSVRQRVLVEWARELYQTGDAATADTMLSRVSDGMSPRKRAQLAAYWQRELVNPNNKVKMSNGSGGSTTGAGHGAFDDTWSPIGGQGNPPSGGTVTVNPPKRVN